MKIYEAKLRRKKSLPFVSEALQPLYDMSLLNLTYSCYITIFFQKSQPSTDKAIVVMPSDQQDHTQ